MTGILHYYPGHFHTPANLFPGTTDTTVGGGLLVFIKNNKEVFRTEAWGGPSKQVPIQGSMEYLPTPAGRYVIGPMMKYHTPSWGYSKIKWGTAIKDSPQEKSLPDIRKTDVWYKLSNGNWASIKKDFGFTRSDIMQRHWELYSVRKVPTTWIFNDFGPVAVRYYKDLNGNKRQDANENLEGTMFHTTPENEAEHNRGIPLKLDFSHGCIHLIPADRSRLIGLKAFKPGTDLIIHPYDKKYKP